MSESTFLNLLENEFATLYEDTQRLVEFAFPESNKRFPKPNREHNRYEAAELAWSICGLLRSTSNMILRESGSMLMHGWSLELPKNAAALAENLRKAHEHRGEAFKKITDKELKKTIKDSEGEETMIAEQLIVLLAIGSRLLGKMYTHLQVASEQLPPLV